MHVKFLLSMLLLQWDLQFNVGKSTVIVISKHDALQIPDMSRGLVSCIGYAGTEN